MRSERTMRLLIQILLFGMSATVPPALAQAQTIVELVQVEARQLETAAQFPGELRAYQAVDIYARVTGFLETIPVDRASRVKAGDLLAEVKAPEIQAQRTEAQAKIPALAAQKAEAEARLAGAESTLQRLREASKTPGAVAGNDVILAEKTVEAERSGVEALAKSIVAAEAAVRAVEEMEKYLRITAPFEGIITERLADPGSLVGPQAEDRRPLLRLEQLNRLRLVVPVPEADVESVRNGLQVSFTVPAHPGRTYIGVVARPAHTVDPATRTMPVELDVSNSSRELAPGMYADVKWPVSRAGKSLLVPPSAIKATTERIFVIRVRGGTAEWVDVRRGMTAGAKVEVFGDLAAGDTIVLRGTDEIRPGTRVSPK
jgi:membrane fusion protein (multidrug efflux system)